MFREKHYFSINLYEDRPDNTSGSSFWQKMREIQTLKIFQHSTKFFSFTIDYKLTDFHKKMFFQFSDFNNHTKFPILNKAKLLPFHEKLCWALMISTIFFAISAPTHQLWHINEQRLKRKRKKQQKKKKKLVKNVVFLLMSILHFQYE